MLRFNPAAERGYGYNFKLADVNSGELSDADA